MKSYLRYYFVIIFSMLVLAGCSDDDETNPTGGGGNNNGDSPAVPLVQFKGPNTTSQDQQVLFINSYIEAMNSFTLYANAFKDLPATKSGNSWVRTYNGNTFTATLTTTTLAAGGYSWRMVMNGTMDSVSYNNFLMAEGTSSADGKTGNWKIYEDNSTTMAGEYTWGYNSNNALVGELKTYDNGTESARISLINNADNSGELNIFDGTALAYKATWTVNGSGQWSQYDSQGNVLQSGSW